MLLNTIIAKEYQGHTRTSEVVRCLGLAGNVARYLTPVIARGVHPSMIIKPNI